MIWYQNNLGIGVSSEYNDQFGYSLAAGDFNNDGCDDLAVGVPLEDIGGKVDAGAMNVILGSPEGLKAGGSVFYQDLGIGDGSEAGDEFGFSLAAGDFDEDGCDDLAVGVPKEDVDDKADAGAVNVLYGSREGLKAANSTNWHQDLGIGDSSEAGDQFGFSLATGDFNGDGRDDLAAGVPCEDIDDKADVGAVNVLYDVSPMQGGGKLPLRNVNISGPSIAGLELQSSRPRIF